MKVKVFGERNTGTRATIAMLHTARGVESFKHPELAPEQEARLAAWSERVETAYANGPWRRVYIEAIRDMRIEAFGPLGAWKHGCPTYNSAYKEHGISALFLVPSRAPDLDLFMRRPWKTVARDRTLDLLATPLELWNQKLASYEVFARDAKADDMLSTWMRFEDFVAHPGRALNASLGALGVDLGAMRTLAPTKPMGKKARERRYYYGQELWRSELTREDVAFINSAIDWGVAEAHGYERLDPESFPVDREVTLNRKTRAATAA